MSTSPPAVHIDHIVTSTPTIKALMQAGVEHALKVAIIGALIELVWGLVFAKGA